MLNSTKKNQPNSNACREQADRDAVEDRTSRTIAIRWGNPQLRMIRKAAELRGIPYQVDIKNAAWEVAKRDLEVPE